MFYVADDFKIDERSKEFKYLESTWCTGNDYVPDERIGFRSVESASATDWRSGRKICRNLSRVCR